MSILLYDHGAGLFFQKMLIESLSGIRGYENDLSIDVVFSYGLAFAEMFQCKKVILGRDPRQSGQKIQNTITSALNESGVLVIDLGICPTPTIQYAVEYKHADGGIVITASHNPLPWNGLKFIGSDGLFLSSDQMASLRKKRIEIGNNLPVLSIPQPKSNKYAAAIRDHINAVLKIPYLDIKRIIDRELKVVVDAVNGAAYHAIPELLTSLNCEVVRINCCPDKPFPHKPEPIPENLEELMHAVSSNRADIGIAIDPDGDRLAIISELGEPISEEYTLVLAEKLVLSKSSCTKKTVVTNLSTTMAVDDIAREYNAEVIRTPIGEINVASKMRSANAVIGGEGNGGVILPDIHLGRDSLVATALVLQILTEEEEPLSKINESLPHYSMVKKKLPRREIDIKKLLPELSKISYPDSINTEDGIKFIWRDRWVHLRPSNTEPIIRVLSEAPTKIEAEQLAAPLMEFLQR